jgi:hypothetical protein
MKSAGFMVMAAAVVVSGLAGCAKPDPGPPDLGGVWLPDESRAEPWPADLPLTPAALEAMKAFDPAQQDPTTFCMPLGTPRNMLQTQYPLEIVQTPQRIVMVLQPNLANAEVRRVVMDGSPLPEAPDPSWYGTSRGRWEGGTLVIETIGLRPDAPITGTGITHSGELRVIERITVSQDADRGRVLVDEIELHDAQAYQTPLKTRRTFVWAPQARLSESSCVELRWIDKLWRDRLQEHAETAKRSAR